MYAINRNVLVIKGKQPFHQWINSIEPDQNVDFEALLTDCDVLLIPDYEEIDSPEVFIKANWDIIFENELNNWYTDEKLWPANRTYKMFKEWFDIEVHTCVFDTVDENIIKEPLFD